MLFTNQGVSRRGFLQIAGLTAVASATRICWADTTSSRLDIARTSTGVRVVATVNPVGSAWALRRSTDGGVTWIILEDQGVIISSDRIRWDIPIEANEPVGLFRGVLVTVIQIGSKTYRIEANGQTLFAAMESLRTSTPSFSFVAEYRTDPEGQFVTAIDGEQGKWVFEVDGQQILNTGSSLYVPKLGQRIKWKLIP